jgi:Uma2 family endonuclease
MSAIPHKISIQNTYFATEQHSMIKHELVAGQIVAMAGASPNHIRITGNIFGNLFSLLDDTCEILGNDTRVKVTPTNYFYPDVTVVCGESVFSDDVLPSLLNPTLIVEVLSESTLQQDRGFKFQRYRMLSSFQEYVLVAQHTVYIERLMRIEGMDFAKTVYTSLEDSVTLESIGCQLQMKDIYRRVKF